MLFKVGERGWVVLLADCEGTPPSLEGPGVGTLVDMTAWGFPRSGAGGEEHFGSLTLTDYTPKQNLKCPSVQCYTYCGANTHVQ